MDVDAIVVGAGANGLVAAVALAEAGLRVTVLEAADRPGGSLRTESVTLPGFRHDIGATVHALTLASPAFRALDLARDGLAFAHPTIPLGHAIAPGKSALLLRDAAATSAGLGGGWDGRRWSAVVGRLGGRWAALAETALDPTRLPPPHPLLLAELGLHGTIPATVAIRHAFHQAPARALFAGLAAHAALPLSAAATSAVAILLGALAHGVGWPVAIGGSQAIADALVARLRSLGGIVETGHRVGSLAELPAARTTVLDVTPRQLLAMADGRLPAGYAARLRRWRYGPGVVKLDWALDAAIPWTDPRLAEAGTVHVGGEAAAVIASEAAVRRGGLSAEPFVLLVQPTVADPTRAPIGKHVAWAYLHVPNGWDGDPTALVEARIEAFAPGFRDRVLARHVMGPAALEAWNPGLVGGDIAGGSPDWRQLVARPRLSTTPWAVPGVDGLYLASGSTAPGPGAHGMAGWLAASAALGRR